jgi:hypothetical protein
LRKHIISLEESTAARAAATADGTKLHRFKEFNDAAASWDRVERIIARVEAGPQGIDTRFIVTSLKGPSGRTVYQDIYCARGQAENHIKAWKTHLAADRTSCCRASANQMRLFLHIGAYWLMWGLCTLMPRRSRWRVAQFDTLRLHLVKLAVRIEVLKTQVRLHLPRCGFRFSGTRAHVLALLVHVQEFHQVPSLVGLQWHRSRLPFPERL